MKDEPVFDGRDAEILAKREAAWNAKSGPRTGDFVKMKDGTLGHLTRDCRGSSIAVTFRPGPDEGDYYLADGANVSYSGGSHYIPNGTLRDIGEAREGKF
jgi:hypothetical protein